MTDVAESIAPLTLTESAAQQVKSMLQDNPDNQGKRLRVYVERGGCSGMQYGLVFDEERPNDILVDSHGVTVLVDPFSANLLTGSKVDYVDSLTGGGFKVHNPQARQSCGCGKSFEA